MKSVPALVCLLALVAAPAEVSAQIYSWRDPAGTLVLSDKPRAGATVTFSVANTSMPIRTTRPVSRRAALFEPLIAEQAEANGVRVDLVRAVIQAESAFNPRAVSPKGAMGLMQLMPATASDFGVRDPFDPAENIRAGVGYLKSLLTRYSNNVELALAAYNAGPQAVKKYGAVPPYRETRNYIARIQSTQSVSAPAASTRIFRTIEFVDGREVVRLSNRESAQK